MTLEEKFEKQERIIKDKIQEANEDCQNAREEFFKKMKNLTDVRVKGLITEQEFYNGVDGDVMEYVRMMNLCDGIIDKQNQKLSILEDIEMTEKESD